MEQKLLFKIGSITILVLLFGVMGFKIFNHTASVNLLAQIISMLEILAFGFITYLLGRKEIKK